MSPKSLPNWTLKSIKMDSWTPMRPLGVPLDPWITKVVPRVPKMEPQGLQNDILAIQMTHFSSQPASSSLHPRGPAAGAKPSNNAKMSANTPIIILNCMK